jgi:hypothetical protein
MVAPVRAKPSQIAAAKEAIPARSLGTNLIGSKSGRANVVVSGQSTHAPWHAIKSRDTAMLAWRGSGIH